MDIILQQDYLLRQEDSASNICLPFTLTRDYARLVCKIKYSPKHITDKETVRRMVLARAAEYLPEGADVENSIDWSEYEVLHNFITLSLDFQEEYLGCAHRHPPEQIVEISQQQASPGFCLHEICAGQWRAVVHVQAVILGQVAYHLVICGMEEGESNDNLPTL